MGDPGTPLLYGVVPARANIMEVLAGAVPQGIGDTVPILHGEHLVRCFRPLEVGARLRSSGRHLATEVKSSGSTVTVLVRLRSEAGELLEEHELTSFLPGTRLVDTHGVRTHLPTVKFKDHDVADGLRLPTDSEQSRRYALASGDLTVFHTSDAEARRYGFPGVIMHGLCTLAVVGNALSARFDGTPGLIGARFSAPGLPGDDILVRCQQPDASLARFESQAPDGTCTITRGHLSTDVGALR
jgi:acyl dehydratase